MKERLVALDDALKGTPLFIVANVHDEVLIEGPTDAIRDPRTLADVTALLETNAFGLRVPIRTAHGFSDRHWREASAGEERVACPREFCSFLHLK